MTTPNPTVWDFEIEYLAKVREWSEKAPESDLYYVSHVVLHDLDGLVVGRYFTGEEARFERGAE